MPKDFNQLTISLPDFGDKEQFLKTLGTIVVDEIVAMIEREEQPDGSPQKQNSPGYQIAKAARKGYTTPLKGISQESPYLARRATFVKAFEAPDRVVIYLNSKRAEIGMKLTDMGYWFMGITKQAEYNIKDRTYKYFQNKMRQMFRGK
jgi:hypothetical protein